MSFEQTVQSDISKSEDEWYEINVKINSLDMLIVILLINMSLIVGEWNRGVGGSEENTRSLPASPCHGGIL